MLAASNVLCKLICLNCCDTTHLTAVVGCTEGKRATIIWVLAHAPSVLSVCRGTIVTSVFGIFVFRSDEDVVCRPPLKHSRKTILEPVFTPGAFVGSS